MFIASQGEANCLSLAGKHGNDALMTTYYDVTNSDVVTKTNIGAPAANGFRHSISEVSNNQQNLENISGNVDISIFDLAGRSIYSYKGEYYEFQKALFQNNLLAKSNIYLIEVTSANGSSIYRYKYFQK